MKTYLWDLDLESIPMGWEETYQKALVECPDGKILVSNRKNSQTRFFYHPVRCREKILLLFNQNKQKAILLMNGERNLPFKETVNELFKIDVILFQLLSFWVSLDAGLFDPKELDTNLCDIEGYFEEDTETLHIPFGINNYADLKLLNLFR